MTHFADMRVRIMEDALRAAGEDAARAQRLAFVAYSAFEAWAMTLPVADEVRTACIEVEREIWGDNYKVGYPTFVTADNRIYRLDDLLLAGFRRLQMTQPDPV